MFNYNDIAIEYCQTKFQILKLAVTIDLLFINNDIVTLPLTDEGIFGKCSTRVSTFITSVATSQLKEPHE